MPILVSREHLAGEMRLRRDFYAARLDGPPDPDQQKDRLDVAHAAPAEIAICRACEILVRREEDAPDFEKDHYAGFVMERMRHAHIDAYRRKAAVYRPLLAEGSRVVEIGSYVGGFLHVAAEWGWTALGVDVGRDTSRFARAHGYATCNGPLEECPIDDASADGIFIWNCFEQIADPDRLLGEVRRILRPRGILVVRVPSAAYYIACESRRDDPAILAALGHANLLGFPHLYGYTPRSLRDVLARHGFTEVRQIGDRHIAPSLRPLNATARREAERVEALVPLPPWLETITSFRS